MDSMLICGQVTIIASNTKIDEQRIAQKVYYL